jgi:hypothetical protein
VNVWASSRGAAPRTDAHGFEKLSNGPAIPPDSAVSVHKRAE